MKITDLSVGMSCSKMMAVTQYDRNGAQKTVSKYILEENLLDVFINEQLTLRMVCTAIDLPALVLGHLYSEGMIESPEEVESIYICENASRAKVFLKHPFEKKDHILEIRACDCGADGVMGRDLLPEGLAAGNESQAAMQNGAAAAQEKMTGSEPWKLEWAYAMVEEFAKESPLHEQTHGTHSAYLSQGGRLLYQCEDIGRHNALDKVIGKALLDHVDLTTCMIFTSGRVPVDMIQKVIRSKVPVLISNTVLTDRALALAKSYGVTLLTSARQNHMDCFTKLCNE